MPTKTGLPGASLSTCRLYARHEVGFYRIIDPEARTLEAMRLSGETWIDVGSFDEHAVARVAPFTAVELDLSKLFPPAPAP